MITHGFLHHNLNYTSPLSTECTESLFLPHTGGKTSFIFISSTQPSLYSFQQSQIIVIFFRLVKNKISTHQPPESPEFHSISYIIHFPDISPYIRHPSFPPPIFSLLSFIHTNTNFFTKPLLTPQNSHISLLVTELSHVCKLLLLGDSGVRKTAIVSHYQNIEKTVKRPSEPVFRVK
jgi:hypothetical protein